MIERLITIKNRAGVHMRPAALIVELTKNFKCGIDLEKGRDRINAKSVMGIITLGASYGTELKIIADGEDEAAAVEALVRLFEAKFEES